MKFYFSTFLIFVAHFCFSQKTGSETFVIQKNQPQNEEDLIYTIPEQLPEFKGGEMALFKFLKANLNFPATEGNNIITGKIIVAFVVNEDGSVSDIKVKKGLGRVFDEEALRVVKMIPNFVPGKHNGKPVRVPYVLPILFEPK
jgi:protein TonB